MTAVLAPTSNELHCIGGEIMLVAAVVALLLAPFFGRRYVNAMSGVIALVGIVIAFFVTFAQPVSGSIFNGLLTADAAAIIWKEVLLVFMIGVLGIWFGSTRRTLPAGDAPEFFTLLLTATVGMMLMGETTQLLMLLLAMEIASMPSYVLAGFRKTRKQSAEAALKFVLFGAVSTAVMIYGLSLLYAAAGSLDLHIIAASLSTGMTGTAAIGFLLLLVGLLFKISAVPMHFWAPDVYEGSPIDVAAFLSVASKGAGVVLLARIASLLVTTAPATQTAVGITIAIVAVITTTLGNLGALRQMSVRRLLAYSSIAHAGYMLSALALINGGRSAVMAYLIIYMVMTLGAFAVLADVENETGSDTVDAFNGLASRAPLSAIALAICLFSMVGLPPAVGFFAKWKVLAALGRGGGWWWAVTASVAINSIISLVFYARVLRAAYFRPAEKFTHQSRSFAGIVAIVCGIALVLMLIFFAPLDRIAERFADSATTVHTPK